MIREGTGGRNECAFKGQTARASSNMSPVHTPISSSLDALVLIVQEVLGNDGFPVGNRGRFEVPVNRDHALPLPVALFFAVFGEIKRRLEELVPIARFLSSLGAREQEEEKRRKKTTFFLFFFFF